MNQKDVIRQIAKDTDLTPEQAKAALQSFSKIITQALQKGAHVQLAGLGTFDTAVRPERVGRNPQNGQILKIKAQKVAKFRPAPTLKNALKP